MEHNITENEWILKDFRLKRIYKTDTYTIGELYINGHKICDVLEDTVRVLKCKEDKIYGKTAIPSGRYKVILSYSNKFQMVLPELLNVPFFTYIRIHAGNDVFDTDGCLLVGECRNVEEGYIYNSQKALKKLMNILTFYYTDEQEIWLTVE